MTKLPTRPFLTARWVHLAMLNYEVDPGILEDLVPDGTKLDFWDGRCFVGVVGFRFLDIRVVGLAIPFHKGFRGSKPLSQTAHTFWSAAGCCCRLTEGATPRSLA